MTTNNKSAYLTLRFAWYDMWIGAFYDRAKRVLYVCPLPMVLITWRLPTRCNGDYVSLDEPRCNGDYVSLDERIKRHESAD